MLNTVRVSVFGRLIVTEICSDDGKTPGTLCVRGNLFLDKKNSRFFFFFLFNLIFFCCFGRFNFAL